MDAEQKKIVSELKNMISALEKEANDEADNLRDSIILRDRKILELIEKIKKKDDDVSKYETIIGMFEKEQQKKDGLLVTFNKEIEKLTEQNKKNREDLIKAKKTAEILSLKLKEYDERLQNATFENAKLLKRITDEHGPNEKMKKLQMLLERIDDKNKTISNLMEKIKENEQMSMEKDKIIISLKKKEAESERLIQILALEKDKYEELNQKLFEDKISLEKSITLRSKKTAELDVNQTILKKKAEEDHIKIKNLVDAIQRLEKQLSATKEYYEKQLGKTKEELNVKSTLFEEEKKLTESKLRKMIKENTESELKFNERIKKLKEIIDKQNHFILLKDEKEKEIVNDIASKFSEIMALKNEVKNMSNLPEFTELIGEKKYADEDVNNLVSMIKIALGKGQRIDDVKKSLLSSGFDVLAVEKAAKKIVH